MLVLAPLALLGQGATHDTPTAWAHLPVRGAVTPKWAAERKKMEAEVGHLRIGGFLRRKEVLAAANASCESSMPAATTAYRAATLYLEFKEDWKIATQGQIGYAFSAMWNTAGSDDPEFVRVVYSGLCLSRNPGDWPKGLGRKLVALFPADKRLKKALVYEAASGQVEDEDVRLALGYVADWEKAGVDARLVAGSRANICVNRYYRTKSRTSLEEAVRALTRLQEVEPNLKERSIAKRMCDDLQQKLAASKP